jgi:hypothetical protein
MLLNAICFLLLCLGPPASPAQQPAPTPADPQDVRKLLRLTGFNQSFEAMLNVMAPAQADAVKASMAAELRKAGKEVDARTLERAGTLFSEGFRRLFTSEALESEAIPIYQKHFTSAEIKGLIEFWGSPLGKKLAATTPTLIQEGALAGRKLAEQAGVKLLQDSEFTRKMRAILEADRQ